MGGGACDAADAGSCGAAWPAPALAARSHTPQRTSPRVCRPVVVTRLLVQDSIEARVLAVQEAKHSLFSGADGGAEDTAGRTAGCCCSSC